MKTIKGKSLSILTVMAALSFSAIAFVPAATAAPATFVVTSTADTSDANSVNSEGFDGICADINGDCTLRAAMEEANGTDDLDTILFNIPGSGVHTIAPATQLPVLNKPTAIDGYTGNSGAAANTAVSPNPFNGTINIALDLSALENDTSGIHFDGADGSTLKGLSITGAGSSVRVRCVDVYNSDDVEIQGNYLGVSSDGMSLGTHPCYGALSVNGSNNVTVGGTNPEDRNVFGNESDLNQDAAFSTNVEDGDQVYVYGNYFGIAKDGVTDLTNRVLDVNALAGPWNLNVLLNGEREVGGTTFGGSTSAKRNVVSGGVNNVIIAGNNNVVQGNFIGTDYTGHPNESFTNGIGVSFSAGQGSLVGGTNPGEGNVIAGLAASGIMTNDFYLAGYDFTLHPTNNAILGNSIYDINVADFAGIGNSNQGIDIGRMEDTTTDPAPDFVPDVFALRGPTPNDEGDEDSGANDSINYPVLKTAVQTGNTLNVSFDLDAAGSTNGSYRVEFFSNDEATIFGYGPGQTYLGFVDVTPGTAKTASLNLGSANVVGKALSATTTAHQSLAQSGYGSTSEFAQNIQVGSDTDFDSDGISDTIEDAAVNDGDGNNDGTADRLQSKVSSYTVGGTPVTFEMTSPDPDLGCVANGSVISEQASVTDTGFQYPYGLTDFTLNCTRGGVAEITKYVFDNTTDDLGEYSVRKYRDNTQTYEDVPDSTVERVTIGGENAMKMSYSLEDGGDLDDDGTINGIIVDPVGLAHVQTSSQNEENNGSASGGSNNGSSDGSASGSDDVKSKSAKGTLSTTGAQYAIQTTQWSLMLLALGMVLVLATRLVRKRYSLK